MQVHIRRANKNENHQITEVLNIVTLDLINKGINQWSYPWKPEDSEQIISTSYVLLINNKIIGTFFVNKVDTLSNLEIPQDSIYLSKIALLPNYQGRRLGLEIINFVCTYTEKINKTLYLDCWAGNEKLKEFYSTSGLNYLGDFPEEDYFISVFKYN